MLSEAKRQLALASYWLYRHENWWSTGKLPYTVKSTLKLLGAHLLRLVVVNLYEAIFSVAIDSMCSGWRDGRSWWVGGWGGRKGGRVQRETGKHWLRDDQFWEQYFQKHTVGDRRKAAGYKTVSMLGWNLRRHFPIFKFYNNSQVHGLHPIFL